MFAQKSCESKITKSIFHIRLSKAGGVLDLSLPQSGLGRRRVAYSLAVILLVTQRQFTVTTRESKSRCKLSLNLLNRNYTSKSGFQNSSTLFAKLRNERSILLGIGWCKLEPGSFPGYCTCSWLGSLLLEANSGGYINFIKLNIQSIYLQILSLGLLGGQTKTVPGPRPFHLACCLSLPRRKEASSQTQISGTKPYFVRKSKIYYKATKKLA